MNWTIAVYFEITSCAWAVGRVAWAIVTNELIDKMAKWKLLSNDNNSDCSAKVVLRGCNSNGEDNNNNDSNKIFNRNNKTIKFI